MNNILFIKKEWGYKDPLPFDFEINTRWIDAISLRKKYVTLFGGYSTGIKIRIIPEVMTELKKLKGEYHE